MQSFRKVLMTTAYIGLCTCISMTVALPAVEASTTNSSAIIAAQSSQISTDTQMPEWLQVLNLDEVQTRQIIEIDALLEQRLHVILTERQYSQWRSSQSTISDATGNETWTFEDINIDLSPYQQAAVDAVFRESFQRVLAILSVEQNRQLLQYLSEGTMTPEPGLGI